MKKKEKVEEREMSSILPISVTDVIKGYAQNHLPKPKLNVSNATKNGDSFSADVYRVIITSGEQEQEIHDHRNTESRIISNIPKEIRLIIKIAPKNEIRRKLFNSHLHFKREKYVYEQILPTLKKFQNQFIDSKMNIFNNYPNLICSEIDGNEYIILNDLETYGFKNSKRTNALSIQRTKTVMINLAKFHAVSFSMKKLNRNKFDEITENLKETIFVKPIHQNFDKFLQQKIINALTTLDRNDDYFVREKLIEFGKTYGQSMIDCVNSSKNEEDKIICHGDMWISNMMFKKKNVNCDEEMCFLDWQVTRVSSPIIDIAYFIFCCTDYKVRQSLQQLLQIYHTNLIVRMKELGCDGNKIFPFTKLLSHMKQYAKFGLGMALMTLHTTTCISEEIPDISLALNQHDLSSIDDSSLYLIRKPAYRERMSDVCRDMVNFGYL